MLDKLQHKKRLQRVLGAGLLVLSGCVGLDLKSGPVSFESPAAVLNLKEVATNAEELNGVTLRLLVPAAKQIQAEEHLKLYSRLRDNHGLSLDLKQKIVTTYHPVAGKDSYIQRTVVTFEKGGEITEDVEISPRGEIFHFIDGRHESPAGKFQVVNESRTAVYPEAPVKSGDKWNYEEKMDVRLDSFWVKEKNPTPYEVKAESQLTGFAEALGRRCAVIKTVSTESKKETMKILFKTVTADITTTIEETDYLDYAHGILAGKVTQTRSHSVFPDLKIEDDGVSQSIYHLTG